MNHTDGSCRKSKRFLCSIKANAIFLDQTQASVCAPKTCAPLYACAVCLKTTENLVSLGRTPSDTLDTAVVTISAVQVYTRVVIVVVPSSQKVAGAATAVASLAIEEIPRAGGEVDGVASVVHRDVNVEVALMFVRSGSLGTFERVSMCRVMMAKFALPGAAGELIGLAVGARSNCCGRGSGGSAQGEDDVENVGEMHYVGGRDYSNI